MSQTEPVRLGALVQTTVTAVLALILSLGVDLPDGLDVAILAVANVVVMWVVAIKTRSLVYAPATVAKAQFEAALDPHPEP